ncbi:unnamed protein product [Laminaria digitata]
MDGGFLSTTACTAIVGGATTLLVLGRLLRLLLGTNGRMNMQGKHCLITGGSSGIGKEVAKQLVRQGAHVTVLARRQGALDAAMMDIKACRFSPSQMVQTVSVDVSDFKAVEKATSEAVAKQGPVQILVNCAGFAIAQELDEMKMEDFERILRVNTLGTAFVTRALLPGMKAAGGGRILMTSSMAGQQTGIYGYCAYSASKFALVGMAQALQMEVKAFGIGVSVAYPPDTDTPGYVKENEGKPAATHLIEEGAGLFSPAQAREREKKYLVALKMVRGLEKGDFCITFGFEGYLVGLATAGFSPCFSLLDATLQVREGGREGGSQLSK